MWRNQLIIGGILIGLTLPVYFLDRALLKPTGTSSFLDFSGLFLWTWLILIALHLILSSLGVHFYPKKSLSSIHLVSALSSIILFVVGYLGIESVYRYKTRKSYEIRQDERNKLADVIQLKQWWLEPSAEDPQEVHVKVSVSESGRFSGGLDARNTENDWEQIFAQRDQSQIQVRAGDEFDYVMDLERFNPGIPDDWQLTFYLFKDENGSASENITKIFVSHPERGDDGHFFYGQLPELSKNEI